jgi:peptide-methionine (S)-S-oxide reductase
MFFSQQKKLQMPNPQKALKGRQQPVRSGDQHFVNGVSFKEPWPDGYCRAVFGLGCFWGAERRFWQTPGVYVTAVGYAAGYTPNPTYEEVCSGGTGHNEVVLVIYDPAKISFEDLLKVFFESHDPTQGMRQGGDRGTQYRSGIYVSNAEELETARAALSTYGAALAESGYSPITTEVMLEPEFYYAEDYHQQYLAKNPGGYCSIGGTGVTCQIGTGIAA